MNRRGLLGLLSGATVFFTWPHGGQRSEFRHRSYGWSSIDGFHPEEEIEDNTHRHDGKENGIVSLVGIALADSASDGSTLIRYRRGA